MGMFTGFILGTITFLVLFKMIFLDSLPPWDERAPGIVVVAAIVSGLLLAYAGHSLQKYLRRRHTK